MKPPKSASVFLPQKQSNSGSIHDLSSEHYEREIKFAAGAVYAVVPASYYGFDGTSHKTAEATIKARKKMGNYSCQIIDRDGNYYDEQNGQLYQTGSYANLIKE